MRILAELVGGITLLLIFAYGVKTTIEFINNKEKTNGNGVPVTEAAPAAAPADEEHGTT